MSDTEEIDITEQANRIDDTAVVEEPALPSTDADSEKDDIDKKDNEPKDMTDDEWAPDQRDKDAEPKKMSTAALPKSLCEYAEDQIRKFTLKIVREDGLLMRLKMIQVTNPDSTTRLIDMLKVIMKHKVRKTKAQAVKIVKKWIIEVDEYRVKQTAEWEAENPDHVWPASELDAYEVLTKLPTSKPTAELASRKAQTDVAEVEKTTDVEKQLTDHGLAKTGTDDDKHLRLAAFLASEKSAEIEIASIAPESSDSDSDSLSTPPFSPIPADEPTSAKPTPEIIIPVDTRVPSPAFSEQSSSSSPGSAQHDTPNVVLSDLEKGDLAQEFASSSVANDFDHRIQRLVTKLKEEGTDQADVQGAVNALDSQGFTPLHNLCKQPLPPLLDNSTLSESEQLRTLDQRKLSAVRLLVEQCGAQLTVKSSEVGNTAIDLACGTGSIETLSYLLGEGSEASGLSLDDTLRMVNGSMLTQLQAFSSGKFAKDHQEPEPEEKNQEGKGDSLAKWDVVAQITQLLMPLLDVKTQDTSHFSKAADLADAALSTLALQAGIIASDTSSNAKHWTSLSENAIPNGHKLLDFSRSLLPVSHDKKILIAQKKLEELRKVLKYVEEVASIFQDLSASAKHSDYSKSLLRLVKTETGSNAAASTLRVAANSALAKAQALCASATAAAIALAASTTAEDKLYHANDAAQNLKVAFLWKSFGKRAFTAEAERRGQNGKQASLALSAHLRSFRDGIERKRHEHVWGSVITKVEAFSAEIAGTAKAQVEVDGEVKEGEQDENDQLCEYFGMRWADLQLRFDQEAEAKEMDSCIALAVEKHDTVRSSILSVKAQSYKPGSSKTDHEQEHDGWLETHTEEEAEVEEDEGTWAETDVLAPNVEFTDKVLKWLRRNDSHYRSRAITRLQQLATGRRSYCLSKRLKTNADIEGMPPLYETKLDQGQRIIWHQRSRKRAAVSASSGATNGAVDADAIFVWRIEKHDAVQRAVLQIQKSYARVNTHVQEDRDRCDQQQKQIAQGQGHRSSASSSAICAYSQVNQGDYLLNPEGNSPLKVYTLLTTEFVPSLAQKMEMDNFNHMFWQPPLRLAGDEDAVVRHPTLSSKMLLGRSGTGKTLCAISAMAHDRQTHKMEQELKLTVGAVDNVMRQVFVARSQKLVNYVQAMLKSKRVIHSGTVAEAHQSGVSDEEKETPLGIDQGPNQNTWFLKLPNMIRSLEKWAGVQERYSPGDKMDANLFESEFWPTVLRDSTVLSVTLSANDAEAAAVQKKKKKNGKSRGAGGRGGRGKGKSSEGGGKAGLTLRPIVVWTNIRSFIKGSVEAVIKGQPLSFDEYTALGKSRVRLSEEQRREVYCVYERYAEWQRKNGVWDEEDRVCRIIVQQLAEGGWKDPQQEVDGEEGETLLPSIYDRIYADEVQDLSQAGCCLLLLAVGRDVSRLFLAGDPAQAVEKGIDFRFTEVKTALNRMLHHLHSADSNQKKYHALKIDDPMTLTINYRSHAGVTNVAAAVLQRMFEAFRGSEETKLPRDTCLARGERPDFLDLSVEQGSGAGGRNSSFQAGNGLQNLTELLGHDQHAVVLTRDTRLTDLKSALREAGDEVNNTCLDIVDSKGLEFSDVWIVDFFSQCEKKSQNSFKNLFAKNYDAAVSPMCPEIEQELKLLYTAITRCKSRLVFIETETSNGTFSKFCSWLKYQDLAKSMPVETDSGTNQPTRLLSGDEWRKRGVNFCADVDVEEVGPNSENDETYKFAVSRLDEAAGCFRKAKDSCLADRTLALKRRLESKWLLFGKTPPTIADTVKSKKGKSVKDAKDGDVTYVGKGGKQIALRERRLTESHAAICEETGEGKHKEEEQIAAGVEVSEVVEVSQLLPTRDEEQSKLVAKTTATLCELVETAQELLCTGMPQEAAALVLEIATFHQSGKGAGGSKRLLGDLAKRLKGLA